jgi:hypothetical protein
VTSICIIGNSHAAALRQGWKAIAGDYPQVSITFFAAPGPLLREVVVEERALVSTNERLSAFFRMTSGGKAEIRPSDYDRIVVAGSGIGIARFSELYRTHRPFDLLSAGTVPISQPCLAASARGFLSSSTGFRIARMLKAPVTFIPEPFPAAGVAASDRWRPIWSDPRIRRNAALTFGSALCEAAARLDSAVLQQPPGTMSGEFTLQEYSRDSMVFTLERKHRVDDHCHMNGDYGALVLQRLLA